MSTPVNAGSYSQYAPTDENGAETTIQPRRLELTLNPEDGSLLTAPLISVLLAATDGLYSDLYNMVQGEIDVTTAIVSHAEDVGANNNNGSEQNDDDNHATVPILGIQTKRERMSKLSFAERRHELSWRLASNGRSLQHVAALCAAAASTQFAEATAISSKALQHTRTAWVQADEAQDALYFFHAQLFPGRAAPHDIYGAGDIICDGQWYDLPRDLRLTVDRYENSVESKWDATETDRRWQLAVRNKLITGEVGWMKRKILLQEQKLALGERSVGLHEVKLKAPLWDVSLRGGVIKLRHGKYKPIRIDSESRTDQNVGSGKHQSFLSTSNKRYPIEALLTVFPNQNPELSEWTLLSIEIHVQAKTGEFNHQLETSNRQRYDLHRLAALAMSREELKCRREAEAEEQKEAVITTNETNENKNKKVVFTETPVKIGSDDTKMQGFISIPARPLHALFQVVHTFALSWQLELLSAQAQALRRGVWAAADGMPVQVTPVRFFENSSKVLGVVLISFWKVDNAFGSPSMGDIHLPENDGTTTNINDESASITSSLNATNHTRNDGSPTSQLALSIRAETDVGIRISLSGGSRIMDELQEGDPSDLRQKQLRSTVHDLLESASNPFCVSASDALLAATKLCSQLKCQAVVEALQPTKDVTSGERKFTLPPWISLSVDRGSISVAAKVQYHGIQQEMFSHSAMPILFKLMCDTRTGSFVSTFARSMSVLRKLCGNDLYYASEALAVRVTSLPENRKRAAGSQASGRMVRDAFDGLIRSMNLLGQRVGVGIHNWDDTDDKSSYLRDRSIHTACLDVKASLVKCCGMACLYGLAPLAFSAATGMDSMPDMAGEAVDILDGYKMLTAPPIGILLNQELIETSRITSDGVNKKTSHIEQSFLAISCSVDETALTLYPLDVSVTLDSPSSIPNRKNCILLKFESPSRLDMPNIRPMKRHKIDDANSLTATSVMVDVIEEVSHFADILSSTIDSELDDDENEMPKI